MNPEGEVHGVFVIPAGGDAGDIGRRRLPLESVDVDRREQNWNATEQLVTTRHQEIECQRTHHHDQVNAPARVLDPESVDDLLLVIVPREPDQIEVSREEVDRVGQVPRE